LALKIPICTFDARTGILCAKCESKLRAGQINEADIQVSRALLQLSEKSSEFNKVSLLRSFKVDSAYVLEVEPSDLSVFRSQFETVRKLEDMLRGKVFVVTASNSDRRFLEDLLYPIRILTVNTVWLPDGSKLTKVIIPGKKDKLMTDFDLLRKIVKEVRGIELTIESEREATLRL
jgi:transcription antitermination factor NusA-like protein